MGSCALEISEEMAIGKHEKAKIASYAARGMKVVVIPKEATASIELPVHKAPENQEPPFKTLDAAEKAMRRVAIKYFFVATMGSPLSSEWKKLHTVQTVIRHVRIPPDSTTIVKAHTR